MVILIKNGSFGVFKDDVFQRIAAFFFLFDFDLKVVLATLGFPIGAGQTQLIAQGPIDANQAIGMA